MLSKRRNYILKIDVFFVFSRVISDKLSDKTKTTAVSFQKGRSVWCYPLSVKVCKQLIVLIFSAIKEEA